MKRTILLKLALLSLCALLLSGCWSKRELNEIGIVTAIGIDRQEEQYKVTVQVINPSEVASKEMTTRTAVSTYTAVGNSIFETIRKLMTLAPRRVYLSHVREIVLGEEMAKEGIGKTLDFLSRDHEMRTDFHLTVAQGVEAEELMKILTPLERIPAEKAFSSIKSGEDSWAPIEAVKIGDVLNAMLSEGNNPTLSGIRIIGDPEQGNHLTNVEQVDSPANFAIDGLAVFRKDHLVGWLNENQSKGYNYITDNVKNTAEYAPCDNDEKGGITLEVFDSTSKLEAAITSNQPRVSINIQIEAGIAEVECQLDLSKTATIRQVEKQFEEHVTTLAKRTIQVLQQDLQSDVLGFGDLIHREDKTYWKSIKNEWDNIFPEVETEVKTTVKVKRTGTIVDSYQKDVEG
ncbi:germination protein GerKC [Thalassobacillus devorans]|uniref:Germination protein GerKC n=1 Tax=Thalassobacillus devorans TaxID=279813 RepID=A0ABQ1PEI6_9BACI|nr:Ger(x)C family spore germination protein [Thalassobacillus devorans]NIK29310.1 spore germination protein KC [Thalassobacillus devorans]GGC95710.1 germination protein GerKC [Thalassobacillus devorans]